MAAGKWLLDLIYPPKCPFCACLLRHGETRVCGRCMEELVWTEPGDPAHEVDFCDGCASPLWYRGLVADGIARYKFQGRWSYAPAFAAWMVECARAHADWEPQVVAWAPLSRERYAQRGYDQARLLAKYVARELGLPLEPLLEKVRDTQAQSGLHEPSRRRANVQGAYRLRDGAEQCVAGRRILLVDDVVTTGATLSECAACLKIAGAEAVFALTLARALK